MTIAIHEPSNSLIVTAPEQLFQEVSQLVKLIDARSVQSVEIISSSKAAAIQAKLQQLFSGGRGTSGGRPGVSVRTAPSPSRARSFPQPAGRPSGASPSRRSPRNSRGS